jgi:hypothetical protein
MYVEMGMNRFLAISAMAAALAVGSAPLLGNAQAEPLNTALSLQAFLFGGHQYCWYDGGWRGPGWYWCGYSGRRGLGWGGGYGWNGWQGGHAGGGGHAGHGRTTRGHANGGHKGGANTSVSHSSAAFTGGGGGGGGHSGGGHSGGRHGGAGGGKGGGGGGKAPKH